MSKKLKKMFECNEDLKAHLEKLYNHALSNNENFSVRGGGCPQGCAANCQRTCSWYCRPSCEGSCGDAGQKTLPI